MLSKHLVCYLFTITRHSTWIFHSVLAKFRFVTTTLGISCDTKDTNATIPVTRTHHWYSWATKLGSSTDLLLGAKCILEKVLISKFPHFLHLLWKFTCVWGVFKWVRTALSIFTLGKIPDLKCRPNLEQQGMPLNQDSICEYISNAYKQPSSNRDWSWIFKNLMMPAACDLSPFHPPILLLFTNLYKLHFHPQELANLFNCFRELCPGIQFQLGLFISHEKYCSWFIRRRVYPTISLFTGKTNFLLLLRKIKIIFGQFANTARSRLIV